MKNCIGFFKFYRNTIRVDLLRIKGILIIIIFGLFVVDGSPFTVTTDKSFNTTELNLKERSSPKQANLSLNAQTVNPRDSIIISEELQYEQTKALDFRTYLIPIFGDTYQGTIRTQDVQINSIVNGDAETASLERWTTLEYSGGEADTGAPQRLASDNPWSYTPQSGNSFYLFDVDSTQLVWIADYFADTSLSSRTTSLSFSFDNAWESGFSAQSNVDLHITFDFDGFDVIFFLYTKYPGSSFPYNTTVGGNHFVHYSINSSWGSGWHDIGPIDISSALIELGMYTESSLPSFTTLNEVRVEALAYNPFKLHLLIDQFSVKTDVEPEHVGLAVNNEPFENGVINNISGQIPGDVDDNYIEFTTSSNRYDINQVELSGNLQFNIYFLEDSINFNVESYFVSGLNIGWLVNFNIPSLREGFLLNMIKILTPPEWDAKSLIDSDGVNQIRNCIIEKNSEERLVRLSNPYTKSGMYSSKFYGPNYITSLEAPSTTNHTVGLPVLLTILPDIEPEITFKMLKLPENDIYLSDKVVMNSTGFNTIFGFNDTITHGEYRLIASFKSKLTAGQRMHDFNITTDRGIIKIFSNDTTEFYTDYILRLQCLDRNQTILENAQVDYTWAMGNGSADYDPETHTYSARLRTNATNGNYTVTIYAFADTYAFIPQKMVLQVQPSNLTLGLHVPTNITEPDLLEVVITLHNSQGQPIEGLPIHILINSDPIAIERILEGESINLTINPEKYPQTNELNITAVVLWDNQVIESNSQIVDVFRPTFHTITESPLNNTPITTETISDGFVTSTVTNSSESTLSNESNDRLSFYRNIISGGGIFVLSSAYIIIRRKKHNSDFRQISHRPENDSDLSDQDWSSSTSTRTQSEPRSTQNPVNQTQNRSTLPEIQVVQTINDFAQDLGISTEDLVSLINERNRRVPENLRWRLVNDLIIPPPSNP